jgi:hypothetical protein
MRTTDCSAQFAGGRLDRHRHICAFFNSLDEGCTVLRSFHDDGFDQGDKAFLSSTPIGAKTISIGSPKRVPMFRRVNSCKSCANQRSPVGTTIN